MVVPVSLMTYKTPFVSSIPHQHTAPIQTLPIESNNNIKIVQLREFCQECNHFGSRKPLVLCSCLRVYFATTVNFTNVSLPFDPFDIGKEEEKNVSTCTESRGLKRLQQQQQRQKQQKHNKTTACSFSTSAIANNYSFTLDFLDEMTK